MDGAEVLRFVADDLGGHGTGGSKTTTSLDVTVEALNDARCTAPLLPPPKRTLNSFSLQTPRSCFSDDATEDGSNVQLQLTTHTAFNP